MGSARFLAILVCFTSVVSLAQTPAPEPSRSTQKIESAYGNLPLIFERNEGQFDRRIQFASRGAGYSFSLTPAAAVMALSAGPAGEKHSIVQMDLLGACSDTTPKGEEPRSTSINYMIGNRPEAWRNNVGAFGKVRYPDVYPGIDLVYYGHPGQLEYDFVVAPGSRPETIALKFSGYERLEIDSKGNLLVSTPAGSVEQHKPVIYQSIDGKRVDVAGSFRRLGRSGIGFEIGSYDHSRELVIDPAISYATRWPATNVQALAVDAAGGLYVTGDAQNPSLPMVNALFDTHHNAWNWPTDAYLMKLSPDGSSIEFSTYLGGTFDDHVRDLFVDGSGNVYLVGQTNSPNFPSTASTFQTNPLQTLFFGHSGFLMKFNSSHQLVYSTFIGSDVNKITVDGSGSPYLIGANFPLTRKMTHDVLRICVAKLSSDAANLIYSVSIPTNSLGETADNSALTLDSFGNVYVATAAFSTKIQTLNAVQSQCATNLNGDCHDIFATKLDGNGNQVYSTFFGGTASDDPEDVAVDSQGNLYITGQTDSLDFPTANAIEPSAPSDISGNRLVWPEAFVVKLSADGSQVLYSTYLSGPGGSDGRNIRVDSSGRALVSGRITNGESTGFPTQGSFLVKEFGESFLSVLNSGGSAFEFSTLLPLGFGAMTTDSSGSNVYIGGYNSGGYISYSPLQNPAYPTGGLTVMKIATAASRPGLTPYVLPTSGPAAGGNQFVLCDAFEGIDKNANPSATFTVQFGGVPATNVDYFFQSTGCIGGTIPAHGPGAVDVTVSTSYGKSGTITRGFTYMSAPLTVTSITPTTLLGPWGAELTFKGTGFTPDTTVDFKLQNSTIDVPPLGIRYVSDTELRVTGGNAGYALPNQATYDVNVASGYQPGSNYPLQTVSLPGSVNFSTPVVAEFSPIVGPSSTGTDVEINGYGLENPTQVTFDGIAGTIGSCPSCSSGTATTPPHVPGTVDMVYSTTNGSYTVHNAFTYMADRPTATSVSPAQGPQAGGTSVTIKGTNFQQGARITFGDVLSPSVSVVDAQTIVAVTPPHPGGPVTVVIMEPDGQSVTINSGCVGCNGFTYDGPAIQGLNPTSGPVAGGTSVTINFLSQINTPTASSAATVTFGGVAATITYYDTYLITVTTPPHAAGSVDVVVSFGGETDTLRNGFAYLGPAPTISTVAPASGPAVGGTTITVSGSNYGSGAQVFVGGVPCKTTFQSSTSLTAVTPGGSAGAKDVTVRNTDGQSATKSSAFTYVAAPAITSLTPASGPDTGGTSVTISGSAFDPAVQITFGGVAAASLTFTNAQTLVAVTPAHVAADVDVVATNPDTQSATKTNGYRYLPPAPTITNFTPTTEFPGATVTITGTNFIFVHSVTFFNGVTANFTVDSPTQITTTVPIAAKTGPITVTTDSGSVATSTDFVVQSAAAQINNFTPTAGPAGTSVVITGLRMGGATSVTFGGVAAASFVINGTTQVTAVVPSNAITGPICITTPGPFTGCSATNFTAAPSVVGFTPAQGLPGVSVTVSGANFVGVTGVSFNGVAAASFSVTNGTSLTATVPAAATTGPISVTSPAGTGASSSVFGVPPAITSFTPTHGGPGTSVTITGVRFTGAFAVRFNGTNAAGFTVVNDTTITATVPSAFVDGPLSVSTPGGTGQSSLSFSLAATPVISSFTPFKGTPGTSVTITGTNFATVTSVRFNGASAAFTINSPTSITATVPGTATNGPISMTNDQGNGSSSSLFYLPPVLTSFTPNAGAPGASMSIDGNDFIGATAVTFNGVSAAFTVNAQDRIAAVVPPTASTGALTVTTPYGSVSSAFAFTVLGASAPTLVATATGPNSVQLAWRGITGDQFEIRRITSRSQNFSTNVIARVNASAYVDGSVSAGNTYLYEVFDVTNGQISNNDYATTIMFTDDPIVAGVTNVKTVHLMELRSAVNAMRRAAELSPATFTDPSPVIVTTTHISELRARLQEALLQLSRYATFTDPHLTSGMPVRAAHFTELREAVK